MTTEPPSTAEIQPTTADPKRRVRWMLVGLVIVGLLIVIGILLWPSRAMTTAQLEATVSQDIDGGHFRAARQLIDAQPVATTSKPAVQRLLAAVDLDLGDGAAALAVIQHLGSHSGWTANLAANAAQAATLAKDNALAISYYRQAITLAEKQTGSLDAEQNIPSYEQQIAQLQKAGP